MVEIALYIAIGALSTSLFLFIIIPMVSRRARRLAMSDLERQAPVTLSEITAQKDQMRADFAVLLNRQEQRVTISESKMQQALIDSERWRVRAEHAEMAVDEKIDDANDLGKKLARVERDLEQQKEIAEKALNAPSALEKKKQMELEEEVDQLRAARSTAKVEIMSLQTELSNAQSRVLELEQKVPAAEELSLRKELKVLAMDVSNFVKANTVEGKAVSAKPKATRKRNTTKTPRASTTESKKTARKAKATRKVEDVATLVSDTSTTKPEPAAEDAAQKVVDLAERIRSLKSEAASS